MTNLLKLTAENIDLQGFIAYYIIDGVYVGGRYEISKKNRG